MNEDVSLIGPYSPSQHQNTGALIPVSEVHPKRHLPSVETELGTGTLCCSWALEDFLPRWKPVSAGRPAAGSATTLFSPEMHNEHILLMIDLNVPYQHQLTHESVGMSVVCVLFQNSTSKPVCLGAPATVVRVVGRG